MCVALDAFVNSPLNKDPVYEIFAGQWSSRVLCYRGGVADLFNDTRIVWFASRCGGFRSKKILEIGPLKSDHTFMLTADGCSSATAIEPNVRALLKCLIVQNVIKSHADIRLGNFVPYLRTCSDRYDVLLASGLL